MYQSKSVFSNDSYDLTLELTLLNFLPCKKTHLTQF